MTDSIANHVTIQVVGTTGSGKSTIARVIGRHLKSIGFDVVINDPDNIPTRPNQVEEITESLLERKLEITVEYGRRPLIK